MGIEKYMGIEKNKVDPFLRRLIVRLNDFIKRLFTYNYFHYSETTSTFNITVTLAWRWIGTSYSPIWRIGPSGKLTSRF